MQNTIKIATIRGAGLSFPIACAVFLFSGQMTAFALVLIGALIGLGVGGFLTRNPAAGQKLQAAMSPARRKTGKPGWLAKYLLHPNLFIRLTSLIVFGSGLLLVTWCIGYYLLPEGVFRAGADAQMARGSLNTASASVVEEWSKIFRANLLPVIILLGGSLLMRVNRFSFGYLVALFNIAGYGLFIGTNSFAIPMPVRLAPSLAILERSGPYEMLALTVLAAAAFGWSFFEVKQLFRTNPERVRPAPKIAWLEIVVFLFGIGILAAANWREASMVIGRTLAN